MQREVQESKMLDFIVHVTLLCVNFYIFWLCVNALAILWGYSDMTERQLLTSFSRVIKNNIPNAFWYKIPDVPGGGQKRPFDIIAIHADTSYAIEFKKQDNQKLLDHQVENLSKVFTQGGLSFTAVFKQNGDIEFIPFGFTGGYTLEREGKTYKDIENLFTNLRGIYGRD